MKKTIGVLAFQGDVIEHQRIIEKLGHRFVAVRSLQDLNEVDALIIPGGESTTIGFFLEHSGLGKEIKRRASAAMPVWGTCAGAIILAKNIQSDIIPPHLGLMDITVQRNAYGRQIDSFYATLQIPALKISDLKAAFIRAPIILKIDEKAQPKVEILATDSGKIVLVRQDHFMASTFHPELTGDTRLHEYFGSFTR